MAAITQIYTIAIIMYKIESNKHTLLRQPIYKGFVQTYLNLVLYFLRYVPSADVIESTSIQRHVVGSTSTRCLFNAARSVAIFANDT